MSSVAFYLRHLCFFPFFCVCAGCSASILGTTRPSRLQRYSDKNTSTLYKSAHQVGSGEWAGDSVCSGLDFCVFVCFACIGGGGGSAVLPFAASLVI